MKTHEDFLYLEIAESLRRRIASGELKPGEQVPPVREMAQHWGCAPGTVSRAYDQLRAEGLVAGRRGRGTRVSPSALLPEHPCLGWANLVNRAEKYMLEAMSAGHDVVEIRAALSVAISRWQDIERTQPGPQRPVSDHDDDVLRFAGSYDLSVDVLAQRLKDATPSIELSIEYLGSLGGLMALARSQADLAGIHLWDQASDTYNLPFVRHLLPNCRPVLVTLAHRWLGLILPPGNPQNLHQLDDLASPDVKLVNRQPGSGTRVWLDAQLQRLGISPESIRGYEREEITDLAVARAVQQGEASVGLGSQAAAATTGLDFQPLTRERYDLVFPESVWNTPQAQALVRVINSSRFKETLISLSGYDTTHTGQKAQAA